MKFRSTKTCLVKASEISDNHQSVCEIPVLLKNCHQDYIEILGGSNTTMEKNLTLFLKSNFEKCDTSFEIRLDARSIEMRENI